MPTRFVPPMFNKRKYAKYNYIEVVYRPNLHGGGLRFGQQFIPVIQEKLGHVGHAFEYCAGAGFIGFSLLANKLCDKLTLGDVNPKAVEICKETIAKNNLESKVSVYLSDCLDGIPESEKWDLAVASPPHVFTPEFDKYVSDRILYDPNFRIHKNFFRDIHKHLKPGGSVIFQEHTEAHPISDFREIIEQNGLKIVEVFAYKNPAGSPNDLPPNYSVYLKKPWKLLDPFHAYRFFRRHFRPYPPRNYYFIWCKIS